MLFNSYAFMIGFLPIVFIVFFLTARISHSFAAAWLALASLFFYGWWSVELLPLLLASVYVNYQFGMFLSNPSAERGRRKRLILGVAVCSNLALLGFFKYANFFIANANSLFAAVQDKPLPLLSVVLPLGISFYTFTQIAFLVDCYEGKVTERNFIHYLLFVTYFPHLIAGPVLHHAQMMPQFADNKTYSFDRNKIALGIAVFTFGLAKKLLIADPLAEYADALFNNVSSGEVSPMLLMSWAGVLAYTFQIYFDFSGYSDMAIGLSLLFGITLPFNFDSPYKATSIIDFWRRWHISLSVFLRDYLYIPLGGNRLGKIRRHINLAITMLLGGLWHGANWTFVLWGGAHGLFLILNHAWNSLPFAAALASTFWWRSIAWSITFACVCLAWVLFRAESVSTAYVIMSGMVGMNGFSLPFQAEAIPIVRGLAAWLGITFDQQLVISGSSVTLLLYIVVASAIAFLLPSSTALIRTAMHSKQGVEDHRWIRLVLQSRGFAYLIGLIFAVSLNGMEKPSPFLYFQF